MGNITAIGAEAKWPAFAPNAAALPYAIRLRGWRLWLTIGFYALGALACIGGAALWRLASATSDLAQTWMQFGLAVSGLLLFWPIYYCFKPTLVLYSDRIEKIRLRDTRSLARTSIEGVELVGDGDQDGGPMLRLKPFEGMGRPITFHSRVLSDPIAAVWFEGIRDLTAEALQASEAEVLTDIRFGPTEAERVKRLGIARRIVQILSGLSFAGYLWVIAYPHPYRWAVGVVALIPWVAAAIVFGSRGLIVWGGDKTTARPSVGSIIWASCGSLVLRAFLDIDILDWPTLLISAALCGLVIAATVSPRDDKPRARVLFVALIAFVPAAYIYGAGAQLNTMFDQSPAEVYRVKVLEKSESSGRTRTFDLNVAAWGDQPAGTHSITHELYDQVAVGSTVCIYRHAGWLHLRWFFIDHCENWTPPAPKGPVVQHHS